jgi:ATP-binding cassette, subfamily B, heavy metal transporter
MCMAKKNSEKVTAAPTTCGKNTINYFQNLREYWHLLGRNKKFLAVAFILTIFLQTFSILNSYLFKGLIDSGTAFGAGSVSQAQFLMASFWIMAAFASIFVFSAIFEWVRNHFTNKTQSEIVLDLKQKYFGRILELDYEFHTSHSTGSTISRFIRASGAVEGFTDLLIYNFSPLIIQLVIMVPILFQLDPIYSVILLAVSAAFLIYTLYISRYFGRDRDLENEALDIEKGKISDVFTNIASVKYFGKNDFVNGDFLSLAKSTKKAQLKSSGWWRWMLAGYQIILGAGTVVLLYFSINQFASGTITLGTLTFIYTAYLGLIAPLFMFSGGIRGFTRSMADMQDLFEYKHVPRKVKDAPDAKPLSIKRGDIEFRNVSFGFENEALFDDFSLKISGGKTIAFVGHSGSGKTSLVKLLYRLYDVKSGSILIDSQDIRSVTQDSLRSEMSIVPQEVILFDDTLYNNIRFSKPDASRDQVLNAIRFSQLDKFVAKLPKKEETIVGERGIKLSGGERQRVAIARALLADKKILVLDEATSSLDSGTENEIQKDLEKLMKGRTTIVIAHRLSTIMKADEIIVMKEGGIVQRGTHTELIGQEGEYKRLWDLQKGGYIP